MIKHTHTHMLARGYLSVEVANSIQLATGEAIKTDQKLVWNQVYERESKREKRQIKKPSKVLPYKSVK